MNTEKSVETKSSVFRFKQFEVENRRSAMKVNTDGVLLAAWAPAAVGRTTVWDVGCGTGVMALMTAQRRPEATIFGIDIDEPSAEEAASNFARSPWSNRLKSVFGDISLVAPSLPDPDLIICNPPFFDTAQHNLVSPEQRKGTARHEGTLSYDSLIRLAAERLTPDGRLCFVSPTDREDSIDFAASRCRLSIERKTFVRTTAAKAPKRILWTLTRAAVPTATDILTIHFSDGGYSESFRNLVNSFYLNID